MDTKTIGGLKVGWYEEHGHMERMFSKAIKTPSTGHNPDTFHVAKRGETDSLQNTTA